MDNHPQAKLNAINSLDSHPGWEVYCARFVDIREKEIDAKIFDPKTPAADREVLVKARQLLSDSYTPEKVVQSMRVALESQITREKSRKP